MELVIDIPEDMKKSIKDGSFGAKYNIHELCGFVVNGITLPKGHGRIIDADELKASIHMNDRNKYATDRDVGVTFALINDAPTLVGTSEPTQEDEQIPDYRTRFLGEPYADMIDDAPTVVEADEGEEQL